MSKAPSSNAPMPLIDAHHHLWNPVSNTPDIGYVWLKKIGAMKPFGDPTPIQRDYLLDEFLAETSAATHLEGSVHVPADGAISDPVAETKWIQSISDATGFPIALVGFVDLMRDDAEETILRHKESSNFVGIRQILSRLDDRPEISFAPEHHLRDPHWQNNFALCEAHDLSFDLQCYPEQMVEIAGFLADFPNVPVIIDHAGSPHDQSPEGLAFWADALRHMAKLPNVSCKISGLGMFDRDWTKAEQIVGALYDVFSAERLMFGSNFPVDKLMRSYDDCLASVKTHLPKQSHSAIFHDNAKRLYKLGTP